MATLRLEPHLSAVTWSSGGAISLELSPKPYTICGVILVIRADISTTTETPFSDYWDRIIANISLSGGGKTYFSFSNARALHHFLRYKGCAAKRPTVLGNSATNAERTIVYPIHFGTEPWVNGRRNWADLTAAIQPVSAGNLTLTGAWGTTNAMGTNVTINTGTQLDVYLYGLQPDDAGGSTMPMALPAFTMATPTPTAMSTPFATSYNLPSGDLLRSVLVMLTNGTNAPRASDVLTSIRVYNQLRNQSIVQYGGQADNADYIRAAEVISTLEMVAPGWPPAEIDGTPGVPAITRENEPGLIYLPLHQFTRVRDPMNPNSARYGADFRGAATGDIQLQYGVADATGITMDVVMERYSLL